MASGVGFMALTQTSGRDAWLQLTDDARELASYFSSLTEEAANHTCTGKRHDQQHPHKRLRCHSPVPAWTADTA
jgi:hypothetical protein